MFDFSYFPADERLSEYIFSYGFCTGNEKEPCPWLSPPNGLTGFIIRTHDVGMEVMAKNHKGDPIFHQPHYAIGQTTQPINGYWQGDVKYFVVFFKPLGMYQLFGKKMSDLTDKSTDLFDFLGQDTARNLIQSLLIDGDLERQLWVLNTFFLSIKPVQENLSDLQKALDIIHSAQGNIAVKRIEESCQIGRRSLERQFQEKIGLSPKVYAQVFRFKCALNYLQQNPNITWTDLSNTANFFDQAHMIRYFQKYVKVSPNNLVTLDMDFVNFLLKH